MPAGRRVDFVEEANPWSVFVLEDGTRLKLRLVMKSIKTTDRRLPDGQPEYDISFQAIIDQAAPETQIQPSSIIKDV